MPHHPPVGVRVVGLVMFVVGLLIGLKAAMTHSVTEAGIGLLLALGGLAIFADVL
jgi:hypothetical protein